MWTGNLVGKKHLSEFMNGEYLGSFPEKKVHKLRFSISFMTNKIKSFTFILGVLFLTQLMFFIFPQ